MSQFKIPFNSRGWPLLKRSFFVHKDKYTHLQFFSSFSVDIEYYWCLNGTFESVFSWIIDCEIFICEMQKYERRHQISQLYHMYRRSSHLQLRLNRNSVYSFTYVFVRYAFFFSLKLHQEFISSKIGPLIRMTLNNLQFY